MSNVLFINCPENTMKLTVADLSQRIDKGEIVSLAIAAVTKNDNIISGHVAPDQVFSLLGALSRLQYKINEIEIE